MWRTDIGNALEVWRRLPAQLLHSVVTSPPYLGLRNYSIAPSVWGGDPACLHAFTAERIKRQIRKGLGLAELGKQYRGGGLKYAQEKEFFIERGECLTCGAWRGCLGLEPSPELYVAHLMMIFDEVYRVLRDDGTLWLNIGDGYASEKPCGWQGKNGQRHDRQFTAQGMGSITDIPPRNLMLMPARISLALQERGWIVRSEIIWHKPNPIPESVTNRPTKAHEQVFLCTKTDEYFYDGYAIREQHTGNAHSRGKGITPKSAATGSGNRANLSFHAAISGRAGLSKDGYDDEKWTKRNGSGARPPMTMRDREYNPAGRNARTVWTIATKPNQWDYCLACGRFYSSKMRGLINKERTAEDRVIRWCLCGESDHWVDHFAMFPEELARRCLLAGTSEAGACSNCGKQWERILVREFKGSWSGPGAHNPGDVNRQTAGDKHAAAGAQPPGYLSKAADRQDKHFSQNRILKNTKAARDAGGSHDDPFPKKSHAGFRPTCTCEASVIPAVVGDPFFGGGTLGVMALRLGRSILASEVSERYAALSQARMIEEAPIFRDQIQVHPTPTLVKTP